MKNHENCIHIQSCCCLKKVRLYLVLFGLQLQGLSKVRLYTDVCTPHKLKHKGNDSGRRVELTELSLTFCHLILRAYKTKSCLY